MMEKRDPERDLVHERFNRLLDDGRIIVEHGLELRSDDLRNQHVMFPIHALDSEMIQECENASRSGVCHRFGHKVTMDLYLPVLAGKFCDGKLEGDIPTKEGLLVIL
jgi:hypothetical protein